ncbi:STAS domain-containing protein [Prevotella sp. P6B4]|uniref:STAS domain-containing protein n=1 Tax=unclassified Prevotella TaxID=2638335 RepID=UPI00048BB205|nr:STAS domain-containing protein [Prevotella sp. P6B4]
MDIKIEKTDERQVTLTLDGRLDTLVSQVAEREVQPLYNYFDCEVVIDCSKLEYISSSGLRLLMHIVQHCWTNHNEPYIQGLQPQVYDVFKTTGFVHLFKFK